MTTRITQIDDTESTTTATRFVVEGPLDVRNTRVLADGCRQALKRQCRVIIDISGVNFIDEASAGILRVFKRAGVSICGSRLFTRLLLKD